MSTEIVRNEDPFSTYKQARDVAFTKVSDFGAFFVGILGEIESDALNREQEHSRRLAAASQQMAILMGEKNALLDQVNMLQRRLEYKTPDPETAEELTRVQAELDIVRTETRRLNRELRESTVDLARVTEERDEARSILARQGDSSDTDGLREQIADLEARVESAREAGQEAVTAAEKAVQEAEQKAAKQVAKARSDSAKELEAAQDDANRRVREARAASGGDPAELEAMRAELSAKDEEIAGLRALGGQAGESASALAVSTLHAMVLENPQLPASRALGLMAAALGQEAPQLPEHMPAYEAPASKDDLFEMPVAQEPLTQPAPEISPDLAHALDQPAPSFQTQSAPDFDTQPAPSFDTQQVPAFQTQQAPAFQAPMDPVGGFFDGAPAGQQPAWTSSPQDAPLGADFFDAAPPAGTAPVADAPLTADFFAKAKPVQAA